MPEANLARKRARISSRMKKFEISEDTYQAVIEAARVCDLSGEAGAGERLLDLHDQEESGPVVNTLTLLVAVRERIVNASGLKQNDRTGNKETHQTGKE